MSGFRRVHMTLYNDRYILKISVMEYPVNLVPTSVPQTQIIRVILQPSQCLLSSLASVHIDLSDTRAQLWVFLRTVALPTITFTHCCIMTVGTS